MQANDKVIIVEGKTDKAKVKPLLREPVDIICTHGTLGIEQLDELLPYLDDKQVFILVDNDDSGERLRKMFLTELPEAVHLYVDQDYREVALTPYEHLQEVLTAAHFDVFANRWE